MTNRKLHNALSIDTKNDDLDDLELYKFSENLSGFHRFRTQQQLNEWSIDQYCQRQRSNWSNFRHAFASLGFLVVFLTAHFTSIFLGADVSAFVPFCPAQLMSHFSCYILVFWFVANKYICICTYDSSYGPYVRHVGLCQWSCVPDFMDYVYTARHVQIN